MSYWIYTVDGKGGEDEMNMNLSWNYSDMMLHLPCGHCKEWKGKQARNLIEPLLKSINELLTHPEKYRQYEKDLEQNLGTIDTCIEILVDAVKLFQRHPDWKCAIDL